MNIYFSGSIRGGQQDTELYKEIIDYLKQFGTVLTEHIGSKTIDTSISDQEIHDRDLQWVFESDIIVAEVTVPSLGVGYEIGRAIEMNKPIICLYRSINGKSTSAMIRGCTNLKCFEYKNINDAKLILKEQFKTINMDWKDISYLKEGSPVQTKAHKCLNDLKIFEILKEYTPVLTGTIPIGISTDSSDLDIACRYFDADRFENYLETHYGRQTNFTVEQKEKAGYWIVVAKFIFQGFKVEIYGALFPVASQNSYRHMQIEHRVLQLLGDDFKQQIIKLKQEGVKTEPAFADLLKIEGDPYQQLLKLETATDSEIISFWKA